jgi:alpha-L-fucosidase 2
MPQTSRRRFLQMAPAAAALTAMGRAADGGRDPSPTTIWYQQPASKWEEALAIGNGRMGAMIFGGIEKERLQLNEITIWSGRLELEADRVDGPASGN